MVGDKMCLWTYDTKDECLLDNSGATHGERPVEGFAFNCRAIKAPVDRMSGGFRPVNDNVFEETLS